MNRFKTLLTVIGLLAIGFAGGFFTHRILIERHISQVASMRNPRDFQIRLLEAIEASSSQKADLEPMIESYADSISGAYCDFWHRRREMVESLYAEMRPHLSNEQVRQMEDFSRRYRKERKKKGAFLCEMNKK